MLEDAVLKESFESVIKELVVFDDFNLLIQVDGDTIYFTMRKKDSPDPHGIVSAKIKFNHVLSKNGADNMIINKSQMLEKANEKVLNPDTINLLFFDNSLQILYGTTCNGRELKCSKLYMKEIESKSDIILSANHQVYLYSLGQNQLLPIQNNLYPDSSKIIHLEKTMKIKDIEYLDGFWFAIDDTEKQLNIFYVKQDRKDGDTLTLSGSFLSKTRIYSLRRTSSSIIFSFIDEYDTLNTGLVRISRLPDKIAIAQLFQIRGMKGGRLDSVFEYHSTILLTSTEDMMIFNIPSNEEPDEGEFKIKKYKEMSFVNRTQKLGNARMIALFPEPGKGTDELDAILYDKDTGDTYLQVLKSSQMAFDCPNGDIEQLNGTTFRLKVQYKEKGRVNYVISFYYENILYDKKLLFVLGIIIALLLALVMFIIWKIRIVRVKEKELERRTLLIQSGIMNTSSSRNSENFDTSRFDIN